MGEFACISRPFVPLGCMGPLESFAYRNEEATLSESLPITKLELKRKIMPSKVEKLRSHAGRWCRKAWPCGSRCSASTASAAWAMPLLRSPTSRSRTGALPIRGGKPTRRGSTKNEMNLKPQGV